MNLLEKIKILRCIKQIFKILEEPSFYPNDKRKNYLTRLFDQFTWGLKYHSINENYNFYGMDIKGSRQDFLDLKIFNKTRDKMIGVRDNEKEYNHTVLVTNKYVFYHYLNSLNIPTPNCLAVNIHGNMMFLNGVTKESDIFNGKNVFAKILECDKGFGVKCLESYDDFKKLKQLWKNENYLLQEAIEQHEELSRLYDKSINTIRIVTVYYNNDAHFFSSAFRCGSKISGVVDNISQGGFCIGINEDGTLKSPAFNEQRYGGPTSEIHPDSGTVFGEIKIPFYKEAIDITCELHRHLYGMGALGWDVAITPNGPIIIEGNEYWYGALNIKFDEDFKEKWMQLCKVNNITV